MMPRPECCTDLLRFSNQLADEAREIANRSFRASIGVTTKDDRSPVTPVDLEIEAHIRERIADRFPDHGILGEEHGGALTTGICWVIDPIDGTKSFVCGIPLFSTLIGISSDAVPFVGVIEVPALRQRWIGYDGVAFLNGERIRTSECVTLDAARMCTTNPLGINGNLSSLYRRLCDEVSITRFGTDAYGYGLLAAGHVDIVVERNLKLHDVVALVPIIEGAGGVITTWDGKPILRDFSGDIIAAATPSLHRQVSEWLRCPDLDVS
jgi:inositol-phosphate phosphatase / L-galactose 1-phosphate phosphatase / histidinol-phosphatase